MVVQVEHNKVEFRSFFWFRLVVKIYYYLFPEKQNHNLKKYVYKNNASKQKEIESCSRQMGFLLIISNIVYVIINSSPPSWSNITSHYYKKEASLSFPGTPTTQ